MRTQHAQRNSATSAPSHRLARQRRPDARPTALRSRALLPRETLAFVGFALNVLGEIERGCRFERATEVHRTCLHGDIDEAIAPENDHPIALRNADLVGLILTKTGSLLGSKPWESKWGSRQPLSRR